MNVMALSDFSVLKEACVPWFPQNETLTHADSESCYLLGRAVTVAEGWGFFPGVCFLAGMGFWQGSCLWVIRVPISSHKFPSISISSIAINWFGKLDIIMLVSWCPIWGESQQTPGSCIAAPALWVEWAFHEAAFHEPESRPSPNTQPTGTWRGEHKSYVSTEKLSCKVCAVIASAEWAAYCKSFDH